MFFCMPFVRGQVDLIGQTEEMLTLSGQVYVLVDGLLCLNCGSGVLNLFPCTGSRLSAARRAGKSCLWQSQPASGEHRGLFMASHIKVRDS